MNCASETGSEASNVNDCCSQRNKRSYRNPFDGTCELCPGTVCNAAAYIYTYVRILS